MANDPRVDYLEWLEDKLCKRNRLIEKMRDEIRKLAEEINGQTEAAEDLCNALDYIADLGEEVTA